MRKTEGDRSEPTGAGLKGTAVIPGKAQSPACIPLTKGTEVECKCRARKERVGKSIRIYQYSYGSAILLSF
jgi:hypothetical protein